MAISDDGMYLYVGSYEQKAIHCFRLPSRAIERSIPVPTELSPFNLSGFRIAVQPGNSKTIVVSAWAGVSVFDDGQARPQIVKAAVGQIAFVDKDTLYGCLGGWLSRLRLTPAGVALETRVPSLCSEDFVSEADPDMSSDGTRLYNRGNVIDPNSLTVPAQLDQGYTVVDNRRIVVPKLWGAISNITAPYGLAVYDKDEFGLRDTLTLPQGLWVEKLAWRRKNGIAILTWTGALTFAELPPWPELQPEGVVSAASGLGGAVSPGEIVSLYGESLSAGDETPAELQADWHFANELLSVRVLFDGVPAPLMYVGPNQVNAVVPYSVAERNMTQIKVVREGKRSAVVSLPVVPARPAIFTLTGTGRGQGAILNQDTTINGSANPARKGSIIGVWATGAGLTAPPGEDGLLVTEDYDYPRPLLPVTATIGGIAAEIQYAGAAPYLVSGAVQINIVVPEEIQSGGDLPIGLFVGSTSSQPGATVAVQ